MDPSDFLILIHRYYPEYRIKQHEVIQSGWDNIVLKVNGTHIFRFTRRQNVVKQFSKELTILPILLQHLELSVPQPEFIQTGDTMPHFMGYRMIPGEPLYPDIVRRNTQQAVSVISQFLLELQSIPIEKLRTTIPFTSAEMWRDDYTLLHIQVKEKVYPLINSETQSTISDTFNEFLVEKQNFMFQPVVVHRDLSNEHILQVSEKITGVIDWGDACLGDPAFDYTGLLYDYGSRFIEKLLSLTGHPESFINRVDFYVKMIPLHNMLYWLEMNNQKQIKKGLDSIRNTYT